MLKISILFVIIYAVLGLVPDFIMAGILALTISSKNLYRILR